MSCPPSIHPTSTNRLVQLCGVHPDRPGGESLTLSAVHQVQHGHQVPFASPPNRARVKDGLCPLVVVQSKHALGEGLQQQRCGRKAK
jgi:hypothetical protein